MCTSVPNSELLSWDAGRDLGHGGGHGGGPTLQMGREKGGGNEQSQTQGGFFAAGDGFVLHHLHVEEEERASPASRSPSVKEG